MRGIVLIAAAVLLSMGAARADDGCGQFAWPLDKERAALAAADKQPIKAGDTLAAWPKAALTVTLRPAAEADFVMPPERKAKAGPGYGGIVHLPAPLKTGLYQIALSDEAWIDVVQEGRYLRSVSHSGRNDCPGLRKVVRFDLSAAPVVLQMSGVAGATINLVAGPAE